MKILLYNTYSINKVSALNGYLGIFDWILVEDLATKVNPKNHVPRMLVSEFLAECSKNYNLQYVISNTDKTVQINKLSAGGGQVKNLSLIAFPDPDISFEKMDFQNGYDFSFDWDPNDEASGVDIKGDVASFPFKGSVATEAALSSISTPAPFDIAYVRNLNAYYQYGGSQWFFYSNNLDRFKTTNSEQLQKISSKMVPMPLRTIEWTRQAVIAGNQVKQLQSGVGVYSSMGMEGESMFAIDVAKMQSAFAQNPTLQFFDMFKIKESRALENAPQPHVCIYLGRIMAPYHPMCSSVPYSHTGIVVPGSGYSQCWNNPDYRGLYAEWWKGFVERLATALQVDYKVLMDALTYSNLNLDSDIIEIDYLRYLCRKANISMPFPSVATLTLVRI